MLFGVSGLSAGPLCRGLSIRTAEFDPSLAFNFCPTKTAS
jgi:hypothetical protein